MCHDYRGMDTWPSYLAFIFNSSNSKEKQCCSGRSSGKTHAEACRSTYFPTKTQSWGSLPHMGRISYRAQFQLFRYPGSKSLTNHSEPSLNPLETNLCTRALAKHRKPLWTCQASKNSSTAEQFLDVRPLQIVLTSSHQSCQFLSKPPQTNSPWSCTAVNAMDFAGK